MSMSKMETVIAETNCGRHNVPEGIPCFHIRMDSREGYAFGICNVRATKVYNGKSTKNAKNFKEKR